MKEEEKLKLVLERFVEWVKFTRDVKEHDEIIYILKFLIEEHRPDVKIEGL